MYYSVHGDATEKAGSGMWKDDGGGGKEAVRPAGEKWTGRGDAAGVSKPTATRDLAELAAAGAIVPQWAGPQTRYVLNHPAFEPIEGINEGISDAVLRLVTNHPGRGVPFFRTAIKASRSTVERVVAGLVAAGAIEHRGSRKSGGYWLKEALKGGKTPELP